MLGQGRCIPCPSQLLCIFLALSVAAFPSLAFLPFPFRCASIALATLWVWVVPVPALAGGSVAPVEDTDCVAVTWVWRRIPGVRAQALVGFGLQSCPWDLWALEH